ncbi:pyridoxal-phosphate dependent enzyme [soil metagenome]
MGTVSPTRIRLDRIEASAAAIDPVFLRTPQFECEALGDVLGGRVTLKVETLNPIRSFKGRGASLFTAREAPDSPLVCASAGNFGQAMAYACARRDVRLIVYASERANALKVERMRALGAEVRLEGDDFDAAKIAAKRFAAERGVRMVEDALEPATAEGAGTIALELIAGASDFDAVLVPLGNGALLAGIATVLAAHRPDVRVVAVQSRGAPAMVESLRSGRLVVGERIDTIADGIGVRIPIPEALADLDGLVDETILVEESSIVAGMQLIHRHAGVVAEPSAAVGVAALLEAPQRYSGAHVVTIVCGGNLTHDQAREWLFDPHEAVASA